MEVINLHSWDYINHIFTKNKNWYKDFYISLEEIEKVPAKRIGNGICVDVYDKYGNFKLNRILKKEKGIKQLSLTSKKITIPVNGKFLVFEI